MIGRLLSGNFAFADGHIYYSNNVIKIRYDLIEEAEKQGVCCISENEVFDFYTNIFDLKKGMKIRSDSPLDSIKSHRFAYVMSDKTYQSPNVLKFLPYLHEGRIYLSRVKKNTEYFYTTMETKVSDQVAHNKKCSSQEQ